MIVIRTCLAAALALSLAACAGPPRGGALIDDPLEGANRVAHSLNKTVDTLALRPAADVYRGVAPEIVRHMVSTGVNTLATPRIAVNKLLQGDWEGLGDTLLRFGVNVVLGWGVFDSASAVGLERQRADFGETLAVWGAEEGVYHELPFLGPATTRDAVGRVVDFFIDPFIFAGGSPFTELGYAELGGIVLEGRANNFEAIDRVLYESADSYAATRAGYVQLRRRRIEGGPTEESLPDVFADE